MSLSPPRRPLNRWIVVLVVVGLLACCSNALGVLWFVQEPQQNAEVIVTQFFQAGARNDAPTAMRLFAPFTYSITISLTRLTDVFTTHADLFAYQSITYSDIAVLSDTYTSSGDISGTLVYRDRPPITFHAQLDRERGWYHQWQLVAVDLGDGDIQL